MDFVNSLLAVCYGVLLKITRFDQAIECRQPLLGRRVGLAEPLPLEHLNPPEELSRFPKVKPGSDRQIGGKKVGLALQVDLFERLKSLLSYGTQQSVERHVKSVFFGVFQCVMTDFMSKYPCQLIR